MNIEKRYRLLFVDDDAIARRVYSCLFEKNFDLDVVETGEEALDLSSKNSFDAILIDLYMPRMSGIELAQKIRSEGHQKEAMLLGVTAIMSDEIKSEALGVGMQHVFKKPLQLSFLKQCLPDLLLGRI